MYLSAWIFTMILTLYCCFQAFYQLYFSLLRSNPSRPKCIIFIRHCNNLLPICHLTKYKSLSPQIIFSLALSTFRPRIQNKQVSLVQSETSIVSKHQRLLYLAYPRLSTKRFLIKLLYRISWIVLTSGHIYTSSLVA